MLLIGDLYQMHLKARQQMSKKCKYALDVGIEKYECTANKCECEYKECDLNKDGSVNVVLCGESETTNE